VKIRNCNIYSGFINTISSKSNTTFEGGFAIPKKTKMKLENQSFTCENPKCGRTFAEPVLVENLTAQNGGSYYACPYCFTETTLEKEESVKSTDEQELESEKTKTEPPKVPEPAKTTPDQRSSETTQKCQHYFGYLSTRSKKDSIPEECMTCEKLIECMLKM
jgi:hypothetical protein